MPRRIFPLFWLSIFIAAISACQPVPPPPASPTPGLIPTASPTLSLTRPPASPTSTPSPVPTATLTPTPTLAPLLRFGIPEDITTTNVWALFDTSGAAFANYAVQAGYWPALFTTSQPGYSFIPELAEDFPAAVRQEGDFWVGIVVMKSGLVWSDGSPLTAYDAAFTAQTSLLFDLGFYWHTSYNPEYLDRVEALDARTLKFYFTHEPGITAWQYGVLQGPVVSQAYWQDKIAPAAGMLQPAALYNPQSEPYLSVRQEAVRLLFELENTDEPAAGPFRFSHWEPGAYVENEINLSSPFRGMQVEGYANGAVSLVFQGGVTFSAYGAASSEKVWSYTRGPFFERVRYIITPPEKAAQALRNGEIDFYLFPRGSSPDLDRLLQGENGVHIVSQVENGFRYLAFNQGRPHWRDPVLRRAVSCMIDVNDLTERVLQGQAEPVYSPVLRANHFWHNADLSRLCAGLDARQRLETAVSLLKDAGYTWEAEPAWTGSPVNPVKPGIGLNMPGKKLLPEVLLLAPTAELDALLADSAVEIALRLGQLGLVVTVQAQEYDGIAAAVYETGQYDMAVMHTWLNVFPDHLCSLFGSGSPYQYSNPVVDQTCETFMTTHDLDLARQSAFKLQKILTEDVPFLSLFTTPVYEAWRGIEYPPGVVLDGFGTGLLGAPDLASPVGK